MPKLWPGTWRCLSLETIKNESKSGVPGATEKEIIQEVGAKMVMRFQRWSKKGMGLSGMVMVQLRPIVMVALPAISCFPQPTHPPTQTEMFWLNLMPKPVTRNVPSEAFKAPAAVRHSPDLSIWVQESMAT